MWNCQRCCWGSCWGGMNYSPFTWMFCSRCETFHTADWFIICTSTKNAELYLELWIKVSFIIFPNIRSCWLTILPIRKGWQVTVIGLHIGQWNARLLMRKLMTCRYSVFWVLLFSVPRAPDFVFVWAKNDSIIFKFNCSGMWESKCKAS